MITDGAAPDAAPPNGPPLGVGTIVALLLLLDPKPDPLATRGTPPNGLGTVLAPAEEGPGKVETAAEEGADVGIRLPLLPAPPKKPPESEPPLLPNDEARTSPVAGVTGKVLTTGGFTSEDVDGVAGAITVGPARGAGAVGAGKAAPKVPDADRSNGFTAAVVACRCD
jgi:hypothetical protein